MNNPSQASLLRRVDWAALAILASAAAVQAVLYFYRVHTLIYGPTQIIFDRFYQHGEVVQGIAASPYNYRVLAPFLAEGLNRLLVALRFVPQGIESFKTAYFIQDLVALFAGLGLLFALLRRWYSRAAALAGSLFAAATMPIALQDHFFQPWSTLEPAFYALAFLLMLDRRRIWLGLVIGLATLNRETAVFIPLAYLFTAVDIPAVLRRKTPVPWRDLLTAAIYLAIWGAIFGGLRLWRGGAPAVASLAELWGHNTYPANFLKTLVNVPLFLGAFWLFAALGLRRAPVFLRRAALIVPFFLALVAAYGLWFEVRLLMPLYPIWIGLGLAALFGPEERVDQGVADGAGSKQINNV